MEALKRFRLSPQKSKKLQAPAVHYGKSLESIPTRQVKPWSETVVAAQTGPNTGLTKLDLDSHDSPCATPTEIAGTHNWDNASNYAFGMAVSLYEEDRTRIASEDMDGFIADRVGEPVADVFGVLVRENSCIMAVADGVSWGKKARLAARCAVRAVMEHISENIPHILSEPNSHTISQLLLESVTKKAHDLIMNYHATLTTLSVAVVCQMEKQGEWGLFVAAVGDSPVYLYCPHEKKVTEVTVGCHQQDGDRDMKMAGGSLGPAIGLRPDLSNLTVAYLPCFPGDIVLMMSDGISDNLSCKVMGPMKKEGMYPPRSKRDRKTQLKPCCESVYHLNEMLNKHQEDLRHHMSAQTVSHRLINHALEVTENKRELRSSCLEKGMDMRKRIAEDADFATRARETHGKLDHATVVSYQVGHHCQTT